MRDIQIQQQSKGPANAIQHMEELQNANRKVIDDAFNHFEKVKFEEQKIINKAEKDLLKKESSYVWRYEHASHYFATGLKNHIKNIPKNLKDSRKIVEGFRSAYQTHSKLISIIKQLQKLPAANRKTLSMKHPTTLV